MGSGHEQRVGNREASSHSGVSPNSHGINHHAPNPLSQLGLVLPTICLQAPVAHLSFNTQSHAYFHGFCFLVHKLTVPHLRGLLDCRTLHTLGRYVFNPLALCLPATL
jgi:hypothetical protein